MMSLVPPQCLPGLSDRHVFHPSVATSALPAGTGDDTSAGLTYSHIGYFPKVYFSGASLHPSPSYPVPLRLKQEDVSFQVEEIVADPQHLCKKSQSLLPVVFPDEPYDFPPRPGRGLPAVLASHPEQLGHFHENAPLETALRRTCILNYAHTPPARHGEAAAIRAGFDKTVPCPELCSCTADEPTPPPIFRRGAAAEKTGTEPARRGSLVSGLRDIP